MAQRKQTIRWQWAILIEIELSEKIITVKHIFTVKSAEMT